MCLKNKPENSGADPKYVYGYDSAVDRYHSHRTAERQASFFLPYLKPGMTVLDVGCASGSITDGLAKVVQPGRVTGIDISEIEIKRAQDRAAREKISNIRFEVGNAYELDYPDDSFDAVFSHNVLEHLSEPEKALQEIRRVLKPGGVIGVRNSDIDGIMFAPHSSHIERYFFLHKEVWKSVSGDPQTGRRLGIMLNQTGFIDIKMSASYDVISGLESCRSFAQIFVDRLGEADFVERVTASGLAKTSELETMKHAWLAWTEPQGAFLGYSHGEAVGWKAMDSLRVDKRIEETLDARVDHFMEVCGYCSQASFAVLQEQLAIECDVPAFIRALRPFPGVALRMETCGAVSGSLIALGLIHGTADRDNFKQSHRCMTLANDFCSRFVEELGSTRCGDIMERQFGRRFDLHDRSQARAFVAAGSREKCSEVVKTAARIAWGLLQKS